MSSRTDRALIVRAAIAETIVEWAKAICVSIDARSAVGRGRDTIIQRARERRLEGRAILNDFHQMVLRQNGQDRAAGFVEIIAEEVMRLAHAAPGTFTADGKAFWRAARNLQLQALVEGLRRMGRSAGQEEP